MLEGQPFMWFITCLTLLCKQGFALTCHWITVIAGIHGMSVGITGYLQGDSWTQSKTVSPTGNMFAVYDNPCDSDN